jgi:hypothetical protein
MKNARFFILIEEKYYLCFCACTYECRFNFPLISHHILPFLRFFCFCIFPPLFTGSLIRYIVDNDGLLLLFFSLDGTKKSTYHHHYHSHHHEYFHSLSFINVLFRIVVGKLIIINTLSVREKNPKRKKACMSSVCLSFYSFVRRK